MLTDTNVSGLRLKSDDHTATVLAVVQSDRGALAVFDDGKIDFVGNVLDNYDVTDETDETATGDASENPSDPT